jgi:hypothetical protein
VHRNRIGAVIALVLVALLAGTPPLHAQGVNPEIWRTFTSKLDSGKTLKVRLNNGQRFKATLLYVTPDAMMVQPKTRAAVPPQQVAFADVETLEVDNGKGIGVAKAVAVGAAVAGGTFVALMAIVAAVLSD